jgi:hypothetical protein
MAALCASRWSAIGCMGKRTKTFPRREGSGLIAPPVGRQSAVSVNEQKPFQEGKARGLLCLPLVGSRLYELYDQEKRLDTVGLLMEVARDPTGILSTPNAVRE